MTARFFIAMILLSVAAGWCVTRLVPGYRIENILMTNRVYYPAAASEKTGDR